MSRGVNLGNWKELYFQNRKRNHVENLLRSLFLSDLFLDGDKTLKVPAILEFRFLWRHLKKIVPSGTDSLSPVWSKSMDYTPE